MSEREELLGALRVYECRWCGWSGNVRDADHRLNVCGKREQEEE